MKKLLFLLPVAAFIIGFASCGDPEPPVQEHQTNQTAAMNISNCNAAIDLVYPIEYISDIHQDSIEGDMLVWKRMEENRLRLVYRKLTPKGTVSGNGRALKDGITLLATTTGSNGQGSCYISFYYEFVNLPYTEYKIKITGLDNFEQVINFQADMPTDSLLIK